MQTVLTIAGFDPSSGAGVTADLMVFAAHSLFATSCITALTVQSTVGVRSTHATSASVVGATLQCLDADLPPAGIKIGMLATKDNVNVICDYLEKLRGFHSSRSETRIPIILDPVLRATSGRELLDPDGLSALRERLLPLVDWITPNLAELAILSGEPVLRRDELPHASRALQAQIAQRSDGQRIGILATGGHLNPPDDLLLLPDGESLWLPGERVVTPSTHGTGCALSSAFLSCLVLGNSPQEAAQSAKLYVTGALRSAIKIGTGSGPINYLWKIHQP
jgi:hydroxymethylpyrimidine/phosphomethylpyrimidine kinase